MRVPTTHDIAGAVKRPSDALASSWVLIVGSVLIAYFWWKHHQIRPPSEAVRGAIKKASEWVGGNPPILPPVPGAPGAPGERMPWPPEALREFASPFAAQHHQAQLNLFHIQGDPERELTR